MELNDNQRGWIGVIGLEILLLIMIPPVGLFILIVDVIWFVGMIVAAAIDDVIHRQR